MTDFNLSLDDDDGLTLETDGLAFDPSCDVVSGGEDEKQAAKSAKSAEGRLQVEEDAEAELSEVLHGFKKRAEREDQRFWDAVDSEYWIAICFQTREQKEEFLNKLNLLDLGDKYLDGMKVAECLGVKLESRIPDMPQSRPFDREYINLAMDF